MTKNSIDQQEIQNFAKDSMHWWDEDGAFKPLHKLNPTRIKYIRDTIQLHFGRKDLKCLDIIDIGCGGGIVCEPLSRLGANMQGVDADAQAIQVALNHAHENDLNISYRNCAAEDIKEQYDVVLALEIIEHVTDPCSFVQSCANLCKPNGLIIFSTLNRNFKSLALGVGAAEYVLKWVPKGTHSWKKFIKPSELASFCRSAQLVTIDICGLTYSPLRDKFSLNKEDIDVNYFMSVRKEG